MNIDLSPLTPCPISPLARPELEKCLRERWDHDSIVRIATGGIFKLLKLQNQTRRWISYSVIGTAEPYTNEVYCWAIAFDRKGQPSNAGLCHLWTEREG